MNMKKNMNFWILIIIGIGIGLIVFFSFFFSIEGMDTKKEQTYHTIKNAQHPNLTDKDVLFIHNKTTNQYQMVNTDKKNFESTVENKNNNTKYSGPATATVIFDPVSKNADKDSDGNILQTGLCNIIITDVKQGKSPVFSFPLSFYPK